MGTRKNADWCKSWAPLFFIPLFLSACAVGPDFTRPEPPKAAGYDRGGNPTSTLAADGNSQRFEAGKKVATEWWRTFGSRKLDEVVDEAVAKNPSLQAAQASLRQSQYLLSAGYGVYFPQVDAGASATRQLFSPAEFGGTGPGTIFNLYTLQATVTYTLDLFGAERRQIEGLGARVDYQRYAAAAAYLSLTGNVVNTVIARAAYDAQIKATEEVVRTFKEQVRLAEIQAQAGTAPYANVLALQSQEAAAETALPPLRQKLSQTEHLLATLAGGTPSEWNPPAIALEDLTLPADLPLSLPSELVRQRPDILVAEADLHAASAEVGVSTAALYPSFTLTGAYGYNNMSVGNLIQNDSNFWNLGSNLTAPLFHGGSLRYQRKAAVEGFNQSLAGYRQTVLGGLAQVADALRSLEHDAEAVDAQARSLEFARQSLRLVEANYKAGVANYLQILVADGQYSQARIGYIQAKGQRLQDTAALFVAMGGGWEGAEGKIIGPKPAD